MCFYLYYRNLIEISWCHSWIFRTFITAHGTFNINQQSDVNEWLYQFLQGTVTTFRNNCISEFIEEDVCKCKTIVKSKKISIWLFKNWKHWFLFALIYHMMIFVWRKRLIIYNSMICNVKAIFWLLIVIFKEMFLLV